MKLDTKSQGQLLQAVILTKEEIAELKAEESNFDAATYYTDGEIDVPRLIKDGKARFIRSIQFDRTGCITRVELRKDRTGCVYLIRSENGLVKIGRAKDVSKRFAALKTASPVNLELLHHALVRDADRLEKALHKEFEGCRVKGEWFALDDHELRLAMLRMRSAEAL